MLPVLIQCQHLNRNVTHGRILLEMVEHGPAQHVRQENIERYGSWMELPGQLQSFCAARGQQAP